jgi:hypothetical protein
VGSNQEWRGLRRIEAQQAAFVMVDRQSDQWIQARRKSASELIIAGFVNAPLNRL